MTFSVMRRPKWLTNFLTTLLNVYVSTYGA